MSRSFSRGSMFVLLCLAGAALTVIFRNFHNTTLMMARPVPEARDTSITGTFRMESDDPAAVWPLHIVVNAPLAFDGMPTTERIVADGAPGGKFVLRNAFGPRVLRCAYDLAPGAKWWPSQVLLDGVDITNVPTDFSAHQDGHLEVVFTQHPAEIRGIVRGAAGLRARAPWVLVAAAKPEFRQPWSTMSHVVHADVRGEFSMTVVPGRYRVTAVPENTFVSDQQASKHIFDLTVRGMTVQVERREIKDLNVALRTEEQQLALRLLPTLSGAQLKREAQMIRLGEVLVVTAGSR